MKKLALMAAIIFLSGCVDHFTVPSAEALKRPFPALNQKVETQLEADGLSYRGLEEEGIGVLAVLKGGPEGFRRNAAFEFFQGLRITFPNVRVVPYRDIIQGIRDADKFQDYTHFVEDYERSRVMDVDRLSAWGRMQGLRYFFIGQVVTNDKHTATQTMDLGEDGVGEKISAVSSGPAHIPFEVEKEVKIIGELWDSKCGQALWIGTSWAGVTEASEIERVRVEDIMTSTTRKLIGALNQALEARRGQAALSDCPS